MKTSDTNKTTSIEAQGPLSETLNGMEQWNINEMKDSLSGATKSMKGSKS